MSARSKGAEGIVPCAGTCKRLIYPKRWGREKALRLAAERFGENLPEIVVWYNSGRCCACWRREFKPEANKATPPAPPADDHAYITAGLSRFQQARQQRQAARVRAIPMGQSMVRI